MPPISNPAILILAAILVESLIILYRQTSPKRTTTRQIHAKCLALTSLLTAKDPSLSMVLTPTPTVV